jgi:regulatory protein
VRRVSEQSLGNAALHYLRRYSATRRGLAQVLARKVKRHERLQGVKAEGAAALIEQVVERMVRAGYVDDRHLAESKRAALQRQGKSTRVIRLKLRAKGVPAEVIAATTQISAQEELEAAAVLARKKRLGVDPARRQRDLATLVRGGFSYDVARRALAAR